jgi:signal transduction histidine kinase
MPRGKRKLNTNAAEFEAVAKALNFSVLLLDSDTNIKFASAQAHKVFGSKDTDALKTEWRDYFDRLKLPDLVQLEKNTKPFHHRTELQTGDSTRLLRMEIYPLQHDKCDCYVMYVKDRELVEGLEQELLHASYHYIQRYLISTLVHDLNAPINTMRITLELIERTLSTAALGASNEFATKWERYKNILKEELGKLKTQVADIPNLFDASGGAVPTSFDVRSVVDGVARFLKHETASKNIRREIDLPEDPITIYGRQSELRLALLNLACGLVEAMKQGGRLQLSMASKEDVLEIILRGDAVDVNQLSSFDYEQLTFSSNGNNLGMFVARLIVEAHGGEVRVNSSVENGWVTLQVMLPNRSPETINANLN